MGHVILTAGAAPSVLANEKGAIAAYIIAIVVFGLGTGGFKPNISPLIAEQIVGEKLRVETKEDGKKVIIDPAATAARIYNWFYLFINIGAFIGQITMAYAALYVGYWLAFLLPTIMFLLCMYIPMALTNQIADLTSKVLLFSLLIRSIIDCANHRVVFLIKRLNFSSLE